MTNLFHSPSAVSSAKPAVYLLPRRVIATILCMLCIMAASPTVTREAKSTVFEPTRAEAQLRCLGWRAHLTGLIDLQERYAVITTALATGLRAEIDRLEIRCSSERPQAVLDRYAGIDRFLSAETQ